jgi:hypothetical protein
MMKLTELTGAALFFIALWITVCYFVGFLSGWHDLARAYRHAGTFVGVRWRFQSGRMRLWMGLHNILTIGINPQGLYLATFVLFRAGTPPLLIPWHDVSPQPGKFLFWKYVEFRFRQAPSVFLRLSFSLAERMRAAAGDSWPLDRGAIWPF